MSRISRLLSRLNHLFCGITGKCLPSQTISCDKISLKPPKHLYPSLKGISESSSRRAPQLKKQLVLKAASGDMKAICEYNKRRERYTLEYVKEQLENLRVILDGEDRIRMYPEDVTDEFKRAISSLKQIIDPHFMP